MNTENISPEFKKLVANWSIETEKDLDINISSKIISQIALDVRKSIDEEILKSMFGSVDFKRHIQLINEYSSTVWLKNYIDILGVIGQDNLITVYRNGNQLKKRITKDEWANRYFADLL